MLKRLANIFSNFFGSIFNGKKKNEPTVEPSIHDKPPGLTEDSSDVPTDTIMVVDIMDVDIPVADNDPGPFADEDKESAIENTTTGDSDSDPNIPDTTDSEPEPDVTDPVDSSDTPPTEDPIEEPEPTTPPPPAHKPRFMWCLDNGHGKLQAGKRSPKFMQNGEEVQFLEFEFNRDIVERIISVLKEKVKHFDIVPDVNEVGSFLEERVGRANKHKSDLPKLFVSVHANAGPAAVGDWVSSSIKGAETWFAHNSTKGKKMAAIFQKHILAETGFKDRKLKSTKSKNLYVLVKTIMPAVLTENGFYNNEDEVKQLMRTSVRQKIADAHVAAIMEIEKNGL